MILCRRRLFSPHLPEAGEQRVGVDDRLNSYHFRIQERPKVLDSYIEKWSSGHGHISFVPSLPGWSFLRLIYRGVLPPPSFSTSFGSGAAVSPTDKSRKGRRPPGSHFRKSPCPHTPGRDTRCSVNWMRSNHANTLERHLKFIKHKHRWHVKPIVGGGYQQRCAKAQMEERFA